MAPSVQLSAMLAFFFFSVSVPLPFSRSLSFNFSSFGNDQPSEIELQGDAFFNKAIRLTKNEVGVPLTDSIGRAVYDQPLHLWDASTRELSDFTTHFSFIINSFNRSPDGDGLAFFLSPYPSVIPANSSGGYLGLYSEGLGGNSTAKGTVAVEFDTYQNPWDQNDRHIGIDVNSINSSATVTWNSSMKGGNQANAWVSYNASTHNLSVFLTYKDNPEFRGNSSVYFIIDLRDVLPEMVAIGFSAATGQAEEIHNLLSWSFSSSLQPRGRKKIKVGVVISSVVGAIALLTTAVGLLWFTLLRKRATKRKMEDEGEHPAYDATIDDEFEREGGPKRFPYQVLARATEGFSEEGKLGEGGFGSVYRGFLRELELDVAIKRVSRGSQQGRKEYISEVKIISRLRHRNLVQLVGWCHDRGEFMLVYEFMPNGSLDSYLYSAKKTLEWPVRHKIALGLASALLYLHEEWEQCVVHRDVKPSNVMLDSAFNAKLGDFGLARLVDHDRGSQTTILAGTMGYLAPECVTSGKASKESDVYSFGIVALEIAGGRRPVEPMQQPNKVRLVEWVWELYGRRAILEAADEKLNGDFDGKQMECLMVVGLWCAHPDYNLRPSIKQVINVLNFEAPLPELPPTMPVPLYYAPPLDMCRFSYASSVATSSSAISASSECITNASNSSASPASSSSSTLRLLKAAKT